MDLFSCHLQIDPSELHTFSNYFLSCSVKLISCKAFSFRYTYLLCSPYPTPLTSNFVTIWTATRDPHIHPRLRLHSEDHQHVLPKRGKCRGSDCRIAGPSHPKVHFKSARRKRFCTSQDTACKNKTTPAMTTETKPRTQLITTNENRGLKELLNTTPNGRLCSRTN